jgi:DnaJ-class molecular chaperone
MSKNVVDTKLYTILDIKPNATEAEIKKSFKKLALKWHPDKWASASDDEKKIAENKFKELSYAYEIIGNPEKRSTYDRFGEDAVKNDGGREMSEEQFREMFGGQMGGLGGMFGGMFGGGGNEKKKEITMPNVEHVIEITLQDVYTGSSVEFEINRYNLKKGKQPTKEDIVCTECKGKGSSVHLEQFGPGMMRQSVRECKKCSGKGSMFPEAFFEKKAQKFAKKIPKGIMDSEKIIIDNKGHEVPSCFKDKFPGQERTDIVLTISEKQNCTIDGHTYVRGANGSPFNLALNLTIEPHEAICGGYRNIPFLGGQNICIKIPSGIIFEKQHIVVVPKMGLPYYKQPDAFGELFVILEVNTNFKPDKTKLSEIWNILTNTSMKDEHEKVLSLTKGTHTDSLTVEDYKRSDAFRATENNARTFNRNMSSGHSRMHGGRGDDMDDEGAGPGMGAQCRQQ